jgi:hypothetical protein
MANLTGHLAQRPQQAIPNPPLIYLSDPRHDQLKMDITELRQSLIRAALHQTCLYVRSVLDPVS